jgi:hypothetical protein
MISYYLIDQYYCVRLLIIFVLEYLLLLSFILLSFILLSSTLLVFIYWSYDDFLFNLLSILWLSIY